MTTILFERISWMFNTFTETLSKLKLAGLLQKIYEDYKNFIEARERRRCSNINHLPEDCLVAIFSKLDQKELITCSAVCKQWKFILDYHSELYHSVNLTLRKHQLPPHIKGSSVGLSITRQQESNRNLVTFLVNKGASVRKLHIDWCFIDQFGFDTLGFLVSSKCCKALRTLSLNWSEDWSFGESPDFDGSYEYFLSLLVLLKKHCDTQLRSICTQFNWTADSVKYLGQFSQVKSLEIRCVPRVHCVQKWHIDKLLGSLKSLKHFRLVVTILPKLVQIYSFKSDSLVTLDVSNCVNLLISEMELPSLQSFVAVNLQCHRMGAHLHKFCLLDVLRNGCPILFDVNGNRVVKDDRDLGLSQDELQKNKICFCPRHNFKIHKSF